MPLFEYILVALLGSGGAPSVTLGADAIVQPNGGALSVGQETPKKEDGIHIKSRADISGGGMKKHPNFTRHKRSGRPVKRTIDTKKDGGKRQ